MSSKNALILVSIILGAILVIVLVAYVGRGGIDPATFDKGQRFTAKPGTTRENALILTSDKRAVSEDPQKAIARPAEAIEDSDPLEVKSLSKPNGASRTGAANDRAQAALNSFSPASGLQMLDEALALPHDREQAALLHEAQGQLYAQLDPPDYDSSQAAFETAIAKADDPDLKEEIVYKSVQTLMRAGRDKAAEKALEVQLASDPPAGETGYKLQLLQGQLRERAGAFEEAENIYQAVLKALEAGPPTLEPDTATGLIRLAGMRLTSLYRSRDRGKAADALSGALKARLGKMDGD